MLIIFITSFHPFIIHPTIPLIQLPEVGLEEVPAQRSLPGVPLQQAVGFFLPQPEAAASVADFFGREVRTDWSRCLRVQWL